ncbi:MAG: hypothetical protein EBQ87_08900 [Planctomycetes bacterium]|nr:hypothetical protein [Planctomycetota bacterium]
MQTFMTFINHYEILEIEADADLSVIKSAFNKLAMKYHPDRNPGDAVAEAMMKSLNQALRILSDSKLRKEHDETLLKNKPNTPPKSSQTTHANENAEAMQAKDLHEAILAFTKAINLNPKDTNAYLNRAAAYKALSDRDIAMAQKTATVKKRKTKGAKEESIDLGKGIKLQIVLILAGKFQMGSDPTDEDHNEDETKYEATISRPFYLGKYQTTQAQWEVVMGYNPSKIKGPDLPVTNVSWDDCQRFIKTSTQIPRRFFVFQPRQSGNLRAGRARKPRSPLGIKSPAWMPIAITKSASPLQWEVMNPMPLAYTTCTGMFPNGAMIGMVFTQKCAQLIHRGRPMAKTG